MTGFKPPFLHPIHFSNDKATALPEFITPEGYGEKSGRFFQNAKYVFNADTVTRNHAII
jgi:hypothetical protein